MIAVNSTTSTVQHQETSIPERFDYQRLLDENRELNQAKGYYKSLHERSRVREDALKQENKELRAELRDLKQRLYGRKSEKINSPERSFSTPKTEAGPKRNKGQQPGTAGHGRRDYSHLLEKEETSDLEQAVCPKCGKPFEDGSFLGTEDSEVIEVEVKAYRRTIHRKRYRKTCQCDGVPGIITAPAPARLIDRGKIGLSIWVDLLLEKYLYQRPINRLLESYKDIDCELPAGTIGDGLKKLAPLFEPVYAEITAKNRTEGHLHADETLWFVFENIEGKKNHRWYMWVFVSDDTVAYLLAPGRGTDVIEKHLNVEHILILSVDRYASYKCYAKDRENVLLAFCWTHSRRDFLTAANRYVELEEWATGWVEVIGGIFHLNNLRISHKNDSPEFADADKALREAIDAMEQKFETELTESNLHSEKAKCLQSLKVHWEGLLVFLDHPWIPMDNSEAERRMYTAALGRKNYYGSGSVWSGHLTASLLSIFQTLKLWNINSRKWLTWYLQECAKNDGRSPPDVSVFLPWSMSKERLAQLQYPGGL